MKSPVGLHKQIDYKAFNKKVQNALKKCSYFMEEAFTCESSLEKINKESSFSWDIFSMYLRVTLSYHRLVLVCDSMNFMGPGGLDSIIK